MKKNSIFILLCIYLVVSIFLLPVLMLGDTLCGTTQDGGTNAWLSLFDKLYTTRRPTSISKERFHELVQIELDRKRRIEKHLAKGKALCELEEFKKCPTSNITDCDCGKSDCTCN